MELDGISADLIREAASRAFGSDDRLGVPLRPGLIEGMRYLLIGRVGGRWRRRFAGASWVWLVAVVVAITGLESG